VRASQCHDAITGIMELPTSASDPVTASIQGGAVTRYAYKASLVGAAHQFELTESGLYWKSGSRSRECSYGDITAIRLSYRPVSMQPHRFRADIEAAGGQRINILSTSWHTVALLTPQDDDYRGFITQLHERMLRAGGKAELVGGVGPTTYAAGIVLLALVGIAVVGLLVRAIATSEWAGGLFLVGFAALFARQIGGFVLRNRPRAYTFDRLPEALLP
jgi:hypothetical protein